MAAPVLLGRLRVLVGDDEVIHNALLQRNKSVRLAYNCGLLLVQAGLVLLNTLLATEENESVAHVQSFFLRSVLLYQLVHTLVYAVLVAAVVGVQLSVRTLGQVAY